MEEEKKERLKVKRYVSDDYVIIGLQGLRTITKKDVVSRTESIMDCFFLNWDYKGMHDLFCYENKVERDNIFDEIKAELEKQRR